MSSGRSTWPDDVALAAFRMPQFATLLSRKSSITNAFVNSLIPARPPAPAEVVEALTVLGLDANDLRCAYCGAAATEWDHLRPLVINRRPTGFITEIANLVPACGKCNQSKGNRPWREWMHSEARLSPARRNPDGLAERAARLDAYSRWRQPTRLDFEAIVGPDEWNAYWAMCDELNAHLRKCQESADALRRKILRHLDRVAGKDPAKRNPKRGADAFQARRKSHRTSRG